MNKRTKRFLFSVIVLFLVLVTLQRFSAAPLATPIWVYAVMLAALVSGIMWLRAKRQAEAAAVDTQWIEQEGNVYIRRLEEKKRERDISN
ncbi:sporulation YhaL family protein [Salsuginibacillus kocurii]|uniref:sporulation YhaL family protein n=1 Tax=Salsuginibacillus kocurii TaxID=427078 RepID=UPI00036ADC2E|nr:sporulation YhaL family protein [Salsuginibacillus kocurii]